MELKKYKVAVIQSTPPYPISKDKSIKKACRLTEAAGKKGAKIIVLPETFIPAYPNWAIEAKIPLEWDKKCMNLIRESIEIPGPEIELLCNVAKSFGSMVCIGVNERDKNRKNSIYNTLVFIGPDGKIGGKHRKLTPVYREKIFWTNGSVKDLNCVFNTQFGKVGGLICAEHLNSLIKSAMIIQGEEIHIACYPGWSLLPKHILDLSIRQYAIECQCFVLAASQYISKSEGSNDKEANWDFYGGSGIVDPTGNYIAGPSYNKDEILYAEVDLSKILERKVWIDVTGKDARWDIIQFLKDFE
ncbi:carbon-nitrogen hydrolase family protein [[Eubacterium] cellulosolvens]